MTAESYDTEFYAGISDGSRRSAAVVVPLILELAPSTRSVVDFGCGSATWLSEFRRCGITDVLGLDSGLGTRDYMFIPKEQFRTLDLTSSYEPDERFDLAMSLEVAEHLPATSADQLIASLCAAAPLVLFSAAIPNQGGTHHVNEQWPCYWTSKFAARGYACRDVLRPRLWDDRRVEWWYRQNLLLFVDRRVASEFAAVASLVSWDARSLVHPELLRQQSSTTSTIPAPAPGDLDALRLYYESSHSWRITRPLREVGRIARTVYGNIRKARSMHPSSAAPRSKSIA